MAVVSLAVGVSYNTSVALLRIQQLRKKIQQWVGRLGRSGHGHSLRGRSLLELSASCWTSTVDDDVQRLRASASDGTSTTCCHRRCRLFRVSGPGWANWYVLIRCSRAHIPDFL